ncbi:sensor histidine kinase [Roseomonas sp. HF4]|uniref:sensor histidine kinase n=1 Tax=Roseomonas sp. HF4 TaxID=2562313 RepID=UPI0010BFF0F0|nr:sensor histidine kinase [Roseomonas sp. HF4]
MPGGPPKAARLPAARRFVPGLRGRLLVFMIAASIPIIGLAGADAWGDFERVLAGARQDAALLRQTAAARHGAEMDVAEEMLRSLAARPDLLAMTPEACDAALAAAHDLFRDRYANIWILDAGGRLQCSALPAEHGVDYSHLDYFRQIKADPRATLGGFTIGVLSGRHVLPSAAPMLAPDGTLRAVVATSVVLDYLIRTQRAAAIADTHHVWLIDRAATAVTLTAAPESALPEAGILERIASEGAQTFEGPARSGGTHVWSVDLVEPGLRLMVGLPMDGIRRAAREALVAHLRDLGLFLGLCIAVVLLGVELTIARPMQRLAARVRVWSPGDPFSPVGGTYDPTEVTDLDTALLVASDAIGRREVELREAVAQRDLAMEEMNHRVHNNLQIIASLLSMQADGARRADVRAEFAIARDRVRALATLYRHLSLRAKLDRHVLRPFIEDLCRQICGADCAAPNNPVALAVEVDAFEIEADQADSLTLLITEAVSNAVQHAFPDGRTGTITVSLRREGDDALLRIEDDGIGLPADAECGAALGLKLIRGFATHLGGSAEIGGAGGTQVVVRFPILPGQAGPRRGPAA